MQPPILDRTTVVHGRTVRHGVLGDGPDVVLCHGTPWSSWTWGDVAHDLARDHRVHVWDMPGFGASSKDAAHAVTLASQGAVLADLLDAWGLRRPHVIAHDVGGAVALRAHLVHGAAFASLALVDVVAVRPWGSELFRLVAEHPDVFERIPEAMRMAMLRAYVDGASHGGLSDADAEALLAPWRGDDGWAAWVRQVAQADEADTDEVESRLGEVAVPTFVVWGEEDTWIPVDRAHRLASEIPGALLATMPDAGHLVQLDAGLALTGVLRAWLAARASHARADPADDELGGDGPPPDAA